MDFLKSARRLGHKNLIGFALFCFTLPILGGSYKGMFSADMLSIIDSIFVESNENSEKIESNMDKICNLES